MLLFLAVSQTTETQEHINKKYKMCVIVYACTVSEHKMWYTKLLIINDEALKSNECYCDAMIQAFNNGNNNNNMVPSTHFLLHVIELRGLKYPNLQAYWIMGQKLA